MKTTYRLIIKSIYFLKPGLKLDTVVHTDLWYLWKHFDASSNLEIQMGSCLDQMSRPASKFMKNNIKKS